MLYDNFSYNPHLKHKYSLNRKIENSWVVSYVMRLSRPFLKKVHCYILMDKNNVMITSEETEHIRQF